jgi:hypothetical protein
MYTTTRVMKTRPGVFRAEFVVQTTASWDAEAGSPAVAAGQEDATADGSGEEACIH